MAAAFIIAGGNFADRPTVLTFDAAAGLILMAILFPLAGEWSTRPTPISANATPSGSESSVIRDGSQIAATVPSAATATRAGPAGV